MAKMVMRELMDPLVFTKFKSFLTKVYDFPSFLVKSQSLFYANDNRIQGCVLHPAPCYRLIFCLVEGNEY